MGKASNVEVRPVSFEIETLEAYVRKYLKYENSRLRNTSGLSVGESLSSQNKQALQASVRPTADGRSARKVVLSKR